LLVAAYVSSHKITTLPAFVSAISNYAKQQRHPELPRHDTYQQVVAGLKNYYGDTNPSAPKTALTLSDLCALHAHIPHSTFEGARDWCACLFAFFGLLRINEYMNSGLQVQHVRRTESGISLQITFSKTSLIPTGIDIVSRDDELCPSRAYAAYMAFFSSPPRPTDALFVSRLRNTVIPTTDAEFIARVREYIRSALPGSDPNDFAGHSFRRGGTSSMKLAGCLRLDHTATWPLEVRSVQNLLRPAEQSRHSSPRHSRPTRSQTVTWLLLRSPGWLRDSSSISARLSSGHNTSASASPFLFFFVCFPIWPHLDCLLRLALHPSLLTGLMSKPGLKEKVEVRGSTKCQIDQITLRPAVIARWTE
jgi:hypothetical protein